MVGVLQKNWVLVIHVIWRVPAKWYQISYRCWFHLKIQNDDVTNIVQIDLPLLGTIQCILYTIHVFACWLFLYDGNCSYFGHRDYCDVIHHDFTWLGFFTVMGDSIVSKGQWKHDYLAFTVLPMPCIEYYFIVDPVTGYDRHFGYIQCLATGIPQNWLTHYMIITNYHLPPEPLLYLYFTLSAATATRPAR